MKREITLSGDSNVGHEGKYVHKDCFEGRKIGILTSGEDSQGMNSAVRAVVRMGIYCGCKVYFIHEGIQGLFLGKAHVTEATWANVSGIMQLGGTIIGSAPCDEFRNHEGRKVVARNLVQLELTNIVIIGGGGSLTGANTFKSEWSILIKELLDEGTISQSQYQSSLHINIVGIVASIDNDFCGTDMTLGTDSALHRIIESCDCIMSTAHSHQRCFILEVMGKHCGYLALVTALITEAEWVFIPEHPPEKGWENKLCEKLINNKDSGQRVNMIVISEGAIDLESRPISAEFVKKLLTSRLNIDCRVTVLAHVQRGGRPSAFDRILGTRMGTEAVLALVDAEENNNLDACVIGVKGNQIIRIPLKKCVEQTEALEKAMETGDFARAVTLRGRSFVNNLNAYIKLTKSSPPKIMEKNCKKIVVINVGAPACGANAVVWSFTRFMISNGYDVIGVQEGFKGFAKGLFECLTWDKVRHWVGIGGSILGIRRDTPESVGLEVVSKKFEELNISGMLIIGGFEAYLSVLQLYKAREKFSNFKIPILCIPSTISNNVPGTDLSIGADTALNEITEIVDKVKQSAKGSTRRVFIVETHGGFCGYLATMAALAGGADAAYIHEEHFGINELRMDVKHLKAKMEDDVQRGLVLINEKASKYYSPEFICRLFEEEGKGVFDAKVNIPGHLQQGGRPSPFDRKFGIKMGSKASDWFIQHFRKTENDLVDACLLGLQKSNHSMNPVWELEPHSNFHATFFWVIKAALIVTDASMRLRIPITQWWLKLRSLLRIMAKHESLYTSEMIMAGFTK